MKTLLKLSVAVCAICLALTWSMNLAYASAGGDIMEAKEQQLDAMREHCAGVMYKRLNAARIGAWRELVNQSRSYADACRTVEDKFMLSRAYEDMAFGLLQLNDPRGALRWAELCTGSNGEAVGCYGKKAEIFWRLGKHQEARTALYRGIMAGEQAIGNTKIQLEIAKQHKPDLRAEPVFRRVYLRKMETLDLRLTNLEESLSDLKDMQDALDAQAEGFR